MRDWASVAGRSRLLLSGSVAHASLKAAVHGADHISEPDMFECKVSYDHTSEPAAADPVLINLIPCFPTHYKICRISIGKE